MWKWASMRRREAALEWRRYEALNVHKLNTESISAVLQACQCKVTCRIAHAINTAEAIITTSTPAIPKVFGSATGNKSNSSSLWSLERVNGLVVIRFGCLKLVCNSL